MRIKKVRFSIDELRLYRDDFIVEFVEALIAHCKVKQKDLDIIFTKLCQR